MSDKTPKPASRVNFKLSGPHTHRGEACNAGDVINIPRSVAKRMESEKSGTIENETASQTADAVGKKA